MTEHAPPDLSDKVTVVTGANSGIGKETAVALAGMGATVVMAVRDRARGEQAMTDIRTRTERGRLVLGTLDLGSLASVHGFAGWFLDEFDRLDVLVNNAGLVVDTRQETADGFEMMFGVNHLGHFLLTDLLRERLVATAPSRVVVVSSLMHRAVRRPLRRSDLQATRRFRGFGAYGRSKLANAQFALELARQLEGTGVSVNCLHPGSIHSNIALDGDTGAIGWLQLRFGRYLLQSPEVGARTQVLLASSEDPRYASVSGGYFSHGRQWQPSRRARDADDARWLWRHSQDLVEEHR